MTRQNGDIFRGLSLISVVLVSVSVSGCAEPAFDEANRVKPKNTDSSAASVNRDPNQPRQVTVQHILIGFQGSVDGKMVERTKEEAEKLALKMYERAKTYDDFGKLVKRLTDDSYPGIYQIVNYGHPSNLKSPILEEKIFSRATMAVAFGDVSFQLEVGEVGLAEYHRTECPYGWHIIKRIK